MTLLDTSVLIELFRVKDKSKTLFFQLSAEEEIFAVSALTHYETFIGAHIAQTDFWTNFFKQIKIIPFDEQCSYEAVQIYKDLKVQNKLIALPDLLIAATALAHDFSLATLNVKHFERVTRLTIKTTSSRSY
jgi:predicted nucleic acid-binding protein